MSTTAWVIGAHGLLGRALTAEVRRRPDWWVAVEDSLPWLDAAALHSAARADARALLDAATSTGSRWAVLWAAGVAVTSAEQDEFDRELAELEQVLDAIAAEVEAAAEVQTLAEVEAAANLQTLTEVPAAGSPGGSRIATTGCLFYASSAGGVYAGSEHPPFTERTPTAPISAYGRFKLAAEALVDRFAERTGVSVINGRIANLYGPGQLLDKAQGLISQLAKAELTRTPMGIYMPLDTMRDYIYTADCAALICDLVERVGTLLEPEESSAGTAPGASAGTAPGGSAGTATRSTAGAAPIAPPLHVVKNLVSHSPVTIGVLLGLFRVIGRRRPTVTLGASALASAQAVDLRLTSEVWSDLDHREWTPLPVGVKATLDDILLSIGRPRQARDA